MNDYDAFREQVREWTRGNLEADPVAAASDLYPDACEAFPELRDLSVRQYRVRYVVPVNRKLARRDLDASRERRRTPPGGGTTREPAQQDLFS